MILKYRVERNNLTDALTEIQEFESRMEVFMEKYPSYTYDIQLERVEDSSTWQVDLKIEKHEQKNNPST